MINEITSGLRFYQSANADPDVIKEDFIIRLDEFNIIMDDIRNNPMKGSVQHYLLLGRRGSGKSTLLKRIQVEIDLDEHLKQSHIAINLAEEQANIYRLYDLLEEIINELEDKEIEVERPEEVDDCNEYARMLFESIHKAIETSGKKIVLLLDNIDRIFENLKGDQSLVRELLLNFDDIKIIGGSTKMTEHFWKYDAPFYEFFRVLELKPLSLDEIKLLLLTWSDKLELPQLKKFVEERQGQLETVRLLTDGLPRTLQFFVNILIRHADETGYEYLKRIMDQVTPLYQERLNNLSPAHRKIILQMAFIWEAASAGEIAEACHMESGTISANMDQLVDNSIVEKVNTGKRSNLYRLAERFFNLWLIFTQGSPKEKRKAKYLTIFLENFYDADGIKSLLKNHLKMLQDGSLRPNNPAMLTKALAQSKYITSAERDQLIDNTMKLGEISDELKKHMPEKIQDIVEQVNDLTKKQKWQKAIKLVESIEQEDGVKELLNAHIYVMCENYEEAEKYLLLAIDKGVVDAVFNLAGIYERQGKIDLAEQYYLKAIDNGNIDAINNIALLYTRQGKNAVAEEYYKKAIEKGDSIAYNNLGMLYASSGKYELAEEKYLEAIERQSTVAYFNLGLLYTYQKKYKDAEKYYLLAIDNGEIEAINNLGMLYAEQDNLILAEKYYHKAAGMGHVKAIYNLGLLYSSQNKYELAEKYYLEAIDKGSWEALNNIGEMYFHQGKFDQAEIYALRAVEEGDVNAYFNLALIYYYTRTNKHKALEFITKAKEADINNSSKYSLWIIISVWNGIVDDLYDIVRTFIITGENEYAAGTMIHLLIHHQVNVVDELFNDNQIGQKLTERLLPVYYAIKLLLGEGKNIKLKIPPEIKETVDKILSVVKEEQELYYGAKKVQ